MTPAQLAGKLPGAFRGSPSVLATQHGVARPIKRAVDDSGFVGMLGIRKKCQIGLNQWRALQQTDANGELPTPAPAGLLQELPLSSPSLRLRSALPPHCGYELGMSTVRVRVRVPYEYRKR